VRPRAVGLVLAASVSLIVGATMASVFVLFPAVFSGIDGQIAALVLLASAIAVAVVRLVLRPRSYGAEKARLKKRAQPAGSAAGMRAVARLMPGVTGQEWLAEARSVLFDAPPQARPVITRSYLLAAPQVLVAAWAGALTGQLRAARGVRVPGGWK